MDIFYHDGININKFLVIPAPNSFHEKGLELTWNKRIVKNVLYKKSMLICKKYKNE